jgi:hypothetical protein
MKHHKQFIVGFNMCGYMPDSEPEVCDTFDEAASHLIWCIKQAIETLENPKHIEQADWIIEMVQAAKDEKDEQEIGFQLDGYVYWINHA